jgi:hypothetical protein
MRPATSEKRRPTHNTVVVSTVMSNIGLREALKALDPPRAGSGAGIDMSQMQAAEAVLGGEDRHVIFAIYQTPVHDAFFRHQTSVEHDRRVRTPVPP